MSRLFFCMLNVGQRIKQQSIVAIVLTLGVLTSTVSANDYLIKNATVYTAGEKGILKNTDVFVSDGFVMQVGKQLRIKSKHEVIDATDKHVTPGLMNAYTQLGLVEISAAKATVDHSTTHQNYGASFNISPAINLKSTLIPHNRMNGLTRAIVAPTSNESIFSGLGSAIAMQSSAREQVYEAIALFAHYGDQGSDIAGGSRASAYQVLDQALSDADYLRNNRNQYRPGHNWQFSQSIDDLDALKPVLEKKIPLVISANRSDDILSLIKLAKKYKISLVINGGAEAWMVAERLALAEVPIIMDPLLNLPSSFESLGVKLEGAAILNLAGVQLLFSNYSSHNAYLVRQSAGNAVAYGLPIEEAIKAMSINIAKVFGVENYGKIELGMEADLVIWDGLPIELTSNPDMVFIQGKKQPMFSRATRLKDRFWDLSNTNNKAFIY